MSHYSDAEDSLDVIDLGLRKRKLWDPETESLTSEIKDLLDDDSNSLVEEECVGCPLPSTPEDENLLDSEMSDVLKAAVLGTGSVVLCFFGGLWFYKLEIWGIFFCCLLLRNVFSW